MEALTARTADRHRLYEASVQNADEEVRIMKRIYRKLYGRSPKILREDFCGTAAVCCRWVRGGPDQRAVGVDLNEEVLEWGRRNNVERLGASANRVTLVHGDVLEPPDVRPDVVTAMNFSYFVFQSRARLLRYFQTVRESLGKKGMFILDIYGGPEAMVLQEEETEYDTFSYVWDQDFYDPLSAHYRCYIHFRFPDGSEMRRAFSYDWRLWGLAEVRDLLEEAGFSRSTVYWEGTDEDGDGNGVFRPVKKADNDAAWVTYIVATP